MKSLIKRGLALTAIAASSCATGLLTPASAAAGDPPRYILESVSNPGSVLTALPYGPASLVPSGATAGQVWQLAPSDRGGATLINLVNRDTGDCLTVPAPAPGLPLMGARCGARAGQEWYTLDDGSGIVRFDSFDGCLKTDFGRVTTGYCGDETSRWRLVVVS